MKLCTPQAKPLLLVALLSALLSAHSALHADEKIPARPDLPWPTPVSASHDQFSLPVNPDLLKPLPSLDLGSQAYTLAQLIELARAHHPATRIAWNEARKAELQNAVVASSYQPKLNAKAAVVVQQTSSDLTLSKLDGGSQHTNQGALVALTADWLLYDFGSRAALQEASQQASTMAKLAYTSAHQQLIHTIALAYYAHAAASARQQNALGSLENAKLITAAAEQRYQRGIGTVMEVAQARQAEAQANLLKVQSQAAEEDAYQALISALGVTPSTRIKLAELEQRPLSLSAVPLLDQFIETALAKRPDIASSYAAQLASQAAIRVAEAEFKPKLIAAASLAQASGGISSTAVSPAGHFSPSLELSGSRRSAGLMLGINLPLYDGGTRQLSLAKARLEAENASLRAQQLRDEAVRQILQARNNLIKSINAYQAAQTLLSAAQISYDAAYQAYRSGVGTLTDLRLTESQLLAAKSSQSDSFSAALAASATLAFASGALGGAP